MDMDAKWLEFLGDYSGWLTALGALIGLGKALYELRKMRADTGKTDAESLKIHADIEIANRDAFLREFKEIVGGLREEIERGKVRIEEMDHTIALLRAELTAKEEQLKALEARLAVYENTEG